MEEKKYYRMRCKSIEKIGVLISTFCLSAVLTPNAETVSEREYEFGYRIPKNTPGLVYNVKVIDREKGETKSGYAKRVHVSGRLSFRRAKENEKLLIATSRIQKLDVSGKDSKHLTNKELGQLNSMTVPYKVSQNGTPRETKEAKQKARQQLKASNSPEILRYAGRLFRGFLLATIPLPEGDGQADKTGSYTWTSKIDICIHDTPMNVQAYPLGDAMVITAQTSFKNTSSETLSLSQKPDKLVAIWRDGKIVKGEYRAYVDGQEMVVKIVHIPSEEEP